MPTELITNTGFETNTTGWESNTAFGAFVAASFARTTSKFQSGTASALVTWPAPGGSSDSIFNTVCSGHVIGQRYRATFWVWVPTGAPNVKAEVIFYASGASTSVKDQWVQISVEYVASTATHHIGVRTADGPTVAGTQVYVDTASAQDLLTTGTWKSPLNLPVTTFTQVVNRGTWSGSPWLPRPITFQAVTNYGLFNNAVLPKITTDMTGSVAPPRKILIDGVLKNLVRQKWPS